MQGLIQAVKRHLEIRQAARFALMYKAYQSVFPSGLVPSYESGVPKLQPGDYKTYVDSYEGWIYKCVSMIATDIGSTELKMFHYNSRTKASTEIEKHIFLDLFNRVNQFKNKRELKEENQTFLDLTGNSYWYLPKNTIGMPQELWLVPAHYMEIIPDKEKFIRGYIYNDGGAGQTAFAEDEIVHFKYANPRSLYYGMGPVEAAMHDVNTKEYMDDYMDALYKNRARPDVILETDQPLIEQEVDRNLSRWNRLFRSSSKASKVALLTHGTKAKLLAPTPQELDFIESNKFSREEVCSFFDMSPLLVGIGKEVANRSVADALIYLYMKNCITPRLNLVAEKINEKIMPLYRSTTGHYYVEFENVVPEDKEFLLKDRESRLKTYMTSVNEERKREGMDPAGWGKTPLAPMAILPLAAGGSPSKSLPGMVDKSVRQEICERKKRVHVEMTKRLENHCEKVVRRLYKQWANKIAKNIINFGKSSAEIRTKDITDFIVIPAGDMESELWEVMKAEILLAMESGFTDMVAEVGFDIDWSPDYTEAVSRLVNRESAIKTVAVKYHNEVKQLLRGMIDEGKTLSEVRKGFLKWFDETELWKANRIAITEMGGARNAGEYTYSQENMYISKKSWLHSVTVEDPRPEHQAMDAQTVEGISKDDYFVFSDCQMLYPGDFNGTAAQIINCHCTLLWE